MNARNAYLAGMLFGSGLLLSRMVNPANVLAFLDLHDRWSPALLITMASAIAIAAPAFAYARIARRTLLYSPVELPQPRPADLRLFAGAVIFGTGWGLSGICPGPALTLLSRGSEQAMLFVAGLVIGTLLAGVLARRSDRTASDVSAGNHRVMI